jgi:hypothetical protein
LVGGRDPYSFENQLNRCEANVDDDNECDYDDNNNDMYFHKMAVLRTVHVLRKIYYHSP